MGQSNQSLNRNLTWQVDITNNMYNSIKLCWCHEWQRAPTRWFMTGAPGASMWAQGSVRGWINFHTARRFSLACNNSIQPDPESPQPVSRPSWQLKSYNEYIDRNLMVFFLKLDTSNFWIFVLILSSKLLNLVT